jgi:hypothetical protein
MLPFGESRQPGGKWWSSDEDSKMVKYSPKYKHGKPVGRREVVEKFKALWLDDLERAFNGGKEFPDHTRNWDNLQCNTVNRKHFAIHARVLGYGYKDEFSYLFGRSKSRLRRRAAKEAVRDELLEFEDCG